LPTTQKEATTMTNVPPPSKPVPSKGAAKDDRSIENDAEPSSNTLAWAMDRANYYWKYGMDDQRILRLTQCRQLQDVWLACRESQKDRLQLEDFPAGIRMVRYFDWRYYPEDKACLREEHAVWACRGIAMQCGGDVVHLRRCLKQQGKEAVLSTSDTSYEEAKKDSVCGDLQEKLGRCVTLKVGEFEARQRDRNESKRVP
jgi:hypothetical protein